MNMMLYYLVIGLAYIGVLWAKYKDGIINVMDKPEYRKLDGPIMGIAAVVLVCIWPYILASRVVRRIKRHFRKESAK